jgi:hypothetical protein
VTDLRVDLTSLRAVSTDLTGIGREFADANVHSDRIADAAGHSGLADAIRSFAHSWDDTRGDMLESIQGLAEAATAVADIFSETDAELARALTEPPAPSLGSRGPQ